MSEILANKLINKELYTNLGFSCARAEALYHIQTATTNDNSTNSAGPVPFIRVNIAATEPKQLDAITPNVIYIGKLSENSFKVV